MHDFVSERDTALARQYVLRIQDQLSRGAVRLDGGGLPLVIGAARIARRGVLYVVNLDGTVLFHPDADRIGAQLPTSSLLHPMPVPAAGTVHGTPRRLGPEVEVAAFRVAQEALSNAVRHGQARQATLEVTFGERELTLSVQDDRVGFTLPTAPDELTADGHFGLVGMQERALLQGGRLDVESRPGAGTRVVAHFPL